MTWKPSFIPDITMDRLVDSQALIDRQRDEIVARYPAIWEKLIMDWKIARPGLPGLDDVFRQLPLLHPGCPMGD